MSEPFERSLVGGDLIPSNGECNHVDPRMHLSLRDMASCYSPTLVFVSEQPPLVFQRKHKSMQEQERDEEAASRAGTGSIPVGSQAVGGTRMGLSSVEERSGNPAAILSGVPSAAVGVRSLGGDLGSQPGALPPSMREYGARMMGYSGDVCSACGSFTMVRNGTCLKCDTCGATSGCS